MPGAVVSVGVSNGCYIHGPSVPGRCDTSRHRGRSHPSLTPPDLQGVEWERDGTGGEAGDVSEEWAVLGGTHVMGIQAPVAGRGGQKRCPGI